MLPRRRVIAALGATSLLGACRGWFIDRPERGPIAALFPGPIDDGGFTELGHHGLMRVRDELRIPVHFVDRVGPEHQPMLAALRRLARSGAAMVVAHGGQASEAAQRVAWEFPDQRFTVIQGSLLRPNLAVYEVLQEESAWLAGAAAGLLTRSNVVGHLSGLRVRSGLEARAAFADGLRTVNPKARLLTTFSGDQDDAERARRIALAQIDAGVDILYTMLDAARQGAIEACRAREVKQIGNASDWVASTPDVFVASAVADPGAAIVSMARDLVDAVWRGDLVRRFGLRQVEVVRLSLGSGVPANARRALEELRLQILGGRIRIPDRYEGPEFKPA